MAAYAEDSYGKPGYFMVFLLYFFSLAIGNVAIAISAVGYLATFIPAASATPIATSSPVCLPSRHTSRCSTRQIWPVAQSSGGKMMVLMARV